MSVCCLMPMSQTVFGLTRSGLKPTWAEHANHYTTHVAKIERVYQHVHKFSSLLVFKKLYHGAFRTLQWLNQTLQEFDLSYHLFIFTSLWICYQINCNIPFKHRNDIIEILLKAALNTINMLFFVWWSPYGIFSAWWFAILVFLYVQSQCVLCYLVSPIEFIKYV